MQRDMELIRSIVRHVQARKETSYEAIEIEGYSDSVVNRHAEMLAEAGYLDASGVLPLENGEFLIMVRDLTWEGHDFAAALANEGVWGRIKQSFPAAELAGLPLTIIKSVGLKLLEAYVMQKTGMSA